MRSKVGKREIETLIHGENPSKIDVVKPKSLKEKLTKKQIQKIKSHLEKHEQVLKTQMHTRMEKSQSEMLQRYVVEGRNFTELLNNFHENQTNSVIEYLKILSKVDQFVIMLLLSEELVKSLPEKIKQEALKIRQAIQKKNDNINEHSLSEESYYEEEEEGDDLFEPCNFIDPSKYDDSEEEKSEDYEELEDSEDNYVSIDEEENKKSTDEKKQTEAESELKKAEKEINDNDHKDIEGDDNKNEEDVKSLKLDEILGKKLQEPFENNDIINQKGI